MSELMKLKGKNIVVYDLEIKKTIEECKKGWGGHDEMGISVAVAFDFRDMRYRIFLDDNMGEFIDRLNESGTLISGFNIVDFDNKVLRGSGYPLKPESELMVYDMLLESRMGALGKPRAVVGGFKLDDHLRVLNLPMKTANGAMAPVWFKEGKLGKVIDYCTNDCMQETALFVHIWKNGTLACEHKKIPYKVKNPQLAFVTEVYIPKMESNHKESDQEAPVGDLQSFLEKLPEKMDDLLEKMEASQIPQTEPSGLLSQSSNV